MIVLPHKTEYKPSQQAPKYPSSQNISLNLKKPRRHELKLNLFFALRTAREGTNSHSKAVCFQRPVVYTGRLVTRAVAMVMHAVWLHGPFAYTGRTMLIPMLHCSAMDSTQFKINLFGVPWPPV